MYRGIVLWPIRLHDLGTGWWECLEGWFTKYGFLMVLLIRR